VHVLNVAEPRESQRLVLGAQVRAFLLAAFSPMR